VSATCVSMKHYRVDQKPRKRTIKIDIKNEPNKNHVKGLNDRIEVKSAGKCAIAKLFAQRCARRLCSRDMNRKRSLTFIRERTLLLDVQISRTTDHVVIQID